MRSLRLCLLLILLSPLQAWAYERVAGWCEQGGVTVSVPGTQGSGTQRFQQSFRGCTVTVYEAGTSNLSTIYDDTSGTAKANPFTASNTGYWYFYANTGRFDVRFSAAGISTPFTLGDYRAGWTTYDCNGFAGATAGVKIAACMTALGATGGVADAQSISGAQTFASTITIPARVTLLLGATTITSAASPAIIVTLGTAGTSGRLVGIGEQTVISYTGASNAVVLDGTGTASAGAEVANLKISGTSSATAGVWMRSFNGGTLTNLHITGFTASGASAIVNHGANQINIFAPDLYNNHHGIRNVGTIVSSTNYAANAVRVFGGNIRNNAGWGWFEDGSGSAAPGPNYSNMLNGVVLETNGANGSSTTGNVFIQQCNGCKLIGSYLEYGGSVIPTQNVVIGDGTYAPTNTSIIANDFLSTTATTSISNVNGQSTYVQFNLETGSVTNFLLNGSAARGLTMFKNRAAAATNKFAGSDDGVDSILFEDTTITSTAPNAMGNTTTGFGFNTIRGFNQDLVIRLRSGGTNILTLDAADGTDRMLFLENGMMTMGGVAFASIGTPSNGTVGYCSNCQVTSGADNTCATGGTGALAVRLNGVWRCFAAQN